MNNQSMSASDQPLSACSIISASRWQTVPVVIWRTGAPVRLSRSASQSVFWAVGGQAASSPKTENYLGFPSGISGADLAERAREQACRFGAEILLAREGVRGEFSAGKRVGYLADGTKLVARAAICATGIEYHRLGLPNEQQFRGAGVYYGAGASEAALCAGNERVFIVGGGNSAGQAAMYFSRIVRNVTMVVRGESLKSTLSAYLVDRIRSAKNVEVLTNTEVTALHGDECLRAVTLTNLRTGKSETFETRALCLHWRCSEYRLGRGGWHCA